MKKKYTLSPKALEQRRWASKQRRKKFIRKTSSYKFFMTLFRIWFRIATVINKFANKIRSAKKQDRKGNHLTKEKKQLQAIPHTKAASLLLHSANFQKKLPPDIFLQPNIKHKMKAYHKKTFIESLMTTIYPDKIILPLNHPAREELKTIAWKQYSTSKNADDKVTALLMTAVAHYWRAVEPVSGFPFQHPSLDKYIQNWVYAVGIHVNIFNYSRDDFLLVSTALQMMYPKPKFLHIYPVGQTTWYNKPLPTDVVLQGKK